MVEVAAGLVGAPRAGPAGLIAELGWSPAELPVDVFPQALNPNSADVASATTVPHERNRRAGRGPGGKSNAMTLHSERTKNSSTSKTDR